MVCVVQKYDGAGSELSLTAQLPNPVNNQIVAIASSAIVGRFRKREVLIARALAWFRCEADAAEVKRRQPPDGRHGNRALREALDRALEKVRGLVSAELGPKDRRDFHRRSAVP